MCGLAGMSGPLADPEIVQAMTRALIHRGPDASGISNHRGTILGHTRLKVIGLSSGGQPMHSADRQLSLVFNGAIYNFRELRRQLEQLGHRFESNSDTEVIIVGYRQWDSAVFDRLDGMFALALWDARRRRLVLARDRFGIKPLHYHFDGSTLRFASEIKAIFRDSGVPRAVDFQALHLFLNLRYVPGERTLFARIRRLVAGHILTFEDGRIRIERYASRRSRGTNRLPRAELIAGIRHYLAAAVRKQQLSDVPVGAYLSGGIDSSSIVALMAESHSSQSKISTFSLGFGEPTDELDDARHVAQTLATDHRESTVTVDVLKHYPATIWAVEEPKENVLQGFLLAALARSGVKVALSGLGGDELFGGYTIHRLMAWSQRLYRIVPRSCHQHILEPASRFAFTAQRSLGSIGIDHWRRGLQFLLSAGDPIRSYLILRNVWDFDPAADSIYGPAWEGVPREPVVTSFAPYFRESRRAPLGHVLSAELRTKLVDDLLLNDDRTSMAHGLEVRVPFLDRDLVDFVSTIPSAEKMRGSWSKSLLREAMAPILPPATLSKPKWGFSFDPYLQFQKDLKGVAEQILTRRRVIERGWFDYSFLKTILDHPPSPRLRWHYFFLWLAMGLEIWARMFLDRHSEPPLELEAYL